MKTTYWVGHTIFRAAAKAFFRYQVVGRDKLVTDGPVLIASNHESFLDPPLVGIAYDDSVYYLARKTLFKGPTKWLYPRWNAIPVDQEAPDMSSLKKIIKILKDGEQVVVFPEGARTLTGKLQPGEAGVGLIAAKSRAVIQPVRIFGAYEALPRGSGRLRFHPVTIVVGDPMTLTPEEMKAKGREAYQAISDRIMAEIAKIKHPSED
ncbi:1-acyl-sn-glycerol-3-phosphate acyltransferase [Akkermansiaceae bacterium]|jgi:1-acyl-sn-glycerol-3-phosphate acyltransferase|nr:1-acyl-sn-glycerol-3-phosphate acyltransferase [bacterium]MDA7891398.1 1-acyl-sn-glycerol-3-phosphate acyltransferase [Akkermansiaceae bacterium]MDA7896044.1 1-acyl-sn-glycerol-3-phosphate acyltransferase [bacterium]MDA7907530.1 1-acyl-sn-glycerol-3-phosphate acyltransferase [Akkermansiaceae bacterium]MDA7933955.1 1-acyl-sn-glycerol-3-phosphate acyltransferase [Akkermansiaceae bacterium]